MANKPSETIMSISTRRRFGWVLACISVLAFIVVQMLFADLRVTEGGSTGNATWYAGHIKLDHSWRTLLPVIGGVIGVLCLAWPSRRPPKLPVRQ